MTLVILVVEVDLLIFTEGVITSLCVTQDSQAHTPIVCTGSKVSFSLHLILDVVI